MAYTSPPLFLLTFKNSVLQWVGKGSEKLGEVFMPLRLVLGGAMASFLSSEEFVVSFPIADSLPKLKKCLCILQEIDAFPPFRFQDDSHAGALLLELHETTLCYLCWLGKGHHLGGSHKSSLLKTLCQILPGAKRKAQVHSW